VLGVGVFLLCGFTLETRVDGLQGFDFLGLESDAGRAGVGAVAGLDELLARAELFS
jgi:hypothetical protein